MNLALNNHPSYKEDVIFIQQYRAKEGELTELARKQVRLPQYVSSPNLSDT
jgi:hypothetical protein